MAKIELIRRSVVEYTMVCAFLVWLNSTAALAQTGAASCGNLNYGGEGIFDYRTHRDMAAKTETFHFTPEVEALIRGKTTEYLAGDIDFMLMHYPNHHRALIAMMRYAEKLKSPQPRGAQYPVECYFDRALRFQPDDNVVRMLYAGFLGKNTRINDAMRQLELVTNSAGENPFTHYSAGLIYMEMKQYDKALASAHRAIDLGFPRRELMEQLKAAGRWSEPIEKSTAPAPDSPASDTQQTPK